MGGGGEEAEPGRWRVRERAQDFFLSDNARGKTLLGAILPFYHDSDLLHPLDSDLLHQEQEHCRSIR
jgi:hypothetical protein